MSTITYRNLAGFGRLGNQLWQIASTIGIARMRGSEPEFPKWPYQKWFSIPEQLFVDVPTGTEAENFAQHIAPTHRPYLQDRGFWAAIEDEIRSYFQPSELAMHVLHLKHPEFFAAPREERLALHIRRGDAVIVGPHLYPLQSPLYVENALRTFDLSKKKVFVFSDDLSWCKGFLSFPCPVYFMLGNSDFEDLFFMSLCGSHIIANSSFSYWGATISGDKEVRYPLRWYGPGFHDLDYRLMIPDGWIGIDDPRAGEFNVR